MPAAQAFDIEQEMQRLYGEQAKLGAIQRTVMFSGQPKDVSIDARIGEISLELRQLVEARRTQQIRYC